MNILIPMAGRGQRFLQEGFKKPKPLIDVNGKPMISRIIKNIKCSENDFFYFIVLKQHLLDFPDMENILLKETNNNCKIIQINEITDGPACTCLLAKEYIPNEEPVLMANSDQILIWNPADFMEFIQKNKNLEGIIITFFSKENIHSYAKLSNDNLVCFTAEKEVISNHASCGVYYWKKYSNFIKSAESMIKKNLRSKNEFYVCPSYNQLIESGGKVGIYEITNDYHIGIPKDLKFFLENHLDIIED